MLCIGDSCLESCVRCARPQATRRDIGRRRAASDWLRSDSCSTRASIQSGRRVSKDHHYRIACNPFRARRPERRRSKSRDVPLELSLQSTAPLAPSERYRLWLPGRHAALGRPGAAPDEQDEGGNPAGPYRPVDGPDGRCASPVPIAQASPCHSCCSSAPTRRSTRSRCRLLSPYRTWSGASAMSACGG